jgi:hypothetical protein
LLVVICGHPPHLYLRVLFSHQQYLAEVPGIRCLV